jgi:hypothetical protein
MPAALVFGAVSSLFARRLAIRGCSGGSVGLAELSDIIKKENVQELAN